MTRNYAALAFLLAVASGCTFTTHNGGAASPEPHEQASNSQQPRPKRHRPAKPRRAESDEVAGAATKPQPEPVEAKPEPKPSEAQAEPKPPRTKPLLRPEPRPSSTKPEPKPPLSKPKPPLTKPEPKPETKPKPEPKPETKPEPKPKPVDKGLDGFIFGKPHDIKAGAADAYFVYFDETGWHIRTTTAGTIWRTFSGKISLSSGKFTSARRVTKQSVDGFVLANQLISFDFKTSVGIDGIDFTVPDAQCVSFELSYENHLDPKVIRIGLKGRTPPSAKFTLCKP